MVLPLTMGQPGKISRVCFVSVMIGVSVVKFEHYPQLREQIFELLEQGAPLHPFTSHLEEKPQTHLTLVGIDAMFLEDLIVGVK